jgi:hypothetical protein
MYKYVYFYIIIQLKEMILQCVRRDLSLSDDAVPVVSEERTSHLAFLTARAEVARGRAMIVKQVFCNII